MKKQRALVIVAALIYTLLFSWIYVHVISPVWAYDGYEAVPRGPVLVLLSLFVAVLPAAFIPFRLRRPSQIVTWILYLLVIVPVAVVPSFKQIEHKSQLVLYWAAMLVSFGVILLFQRFPLLRLRRISIPKPVFWTAILCAGLVSYVYLSTRFRVHLAIESITDVYGTRSEYKAGVGTVGAIVAYLVNWNAYVINPFLIAFGLLKKRTWIVVGATIGQVAIFSFTGFKQVFFSGLLIGALLIILRIKRVAFGVAMTWGAIVVMLLAIMTDKLFNSLVLTNLFVRRLIATPGVNTAHFFEFFTDHPKALLGHSFLGAFVDYPYPLAPSELMGLLYQGSAETSANANLWADAYANFGYLGLIGFSIVLAFVLWAYDSVTKGEDLRLSGLLIAVPCFGLVNAALFSSLLSHGILAALAIAFLVPAKSLRQARQVTSREGLIQPVRAEAPG